MSVFVSQNSQECQFSTGESWVILSPIEQSIKHKIEAAGKPLKDWDINIYRGILTGYNEAFIIDGKKKDELIAEDPKSADIIRPILRGRDIKRYGYDFADLWLINAHNGTKETGIKPINIEEYPAIKNHLDSFYTQLEKRADKGDTLYNLRNCAYMDDFYKQKIVWAELARTGNSFTIDDKGYLLGNTGYIMVIKDGFEKKLSYFYLVAILNSKPILYYLDKISSRLDETGWRWLRQYVENLPIPLLKIEKQSMFDSFVKREFQIKTKEGQEEIDSFVNEIFGFTKEEITFLNNSY